MLFLFFSFVKYGYSQSKENIDSVLNILNTVSKDTAYVNKLNSLASSISSSDVDKSFSLSEQSLKISKKINFVEGQAAAYTNIGSIYKAKGDFKNAIESYKMAIDLNRKINDINNLSLVYKNLGDVYRNMMDYDNTVAYYNKGLYYAKKCGNKKVMAGVYNGFGNLYMHLVSDSFDVATLYYFKALKLDEEIGNIDGIAREYTNIGQVFLRQENHNKAIEYLKKALAIYKERNSLAPQGNVLNSLGAVCFYQKKYEKSLEYYLEGLQILEKINLKKEIADIKINIGHIYVELKDYEKANKYFLESLEAARDINNKTSIAGALVNLTNSYAFSGNYTEAEKYGLEGLELAKELKSPEKIRFVCLSLALVYEKRGNYKKANECNKLYAQVNDSMLSAESRKQVAEMEVKYNSEKKDLKISELNFKDKIQQLEIQQKNYSITAIIIGVAFVLLIIVLGFVLYTRYKDRKELLLENQKIKIEKDLLELEKRFLISQMNPHFIFNSLNSIETFMLMNDIEKASGYLNDFAKLIRIILETSREEFISLEEEITMLNYYLKLEQLRLNHSFDYEFEIDAALKNQLNKTDIPPMLLQPFVENAIIHGVNKLDKKGIINLNFSTTHDNLIEIVISDNGIGRKKSSETNTVIAGKHESLAMKITMERVDVIYKKYALKIDVKIEDLFSENGESQGTKVYICLPKIEF